MHARPCDLRLASEQIPKLPGYSQILRFPDALSGPACFLVMPSHKEQRYLALWLVLCWLGVYFMFSGLWVGVVGAGRGIRYETQTPVCRDFVWEIGCGEARV